MLSFDNWQLLRESLKTSDFDAIVKEIEEALEPKMGTLYSVPNFTVFRRTGEPVQQTILFTNDKFQTFTVNYTNDGKFFSIDFWKADQSKPTVTLYANGKSLKSCLPLVPMIAKDPHPDLSMEKLRKKAEAGVLEDEEFVSNTDGSKVTIEKAKDRKEVETKLEKSLPKGPSRYIYGDPETIFEDFRRYVDMVIEGIQPSLLVTGSPGVGKTYMVTTRLKEHKLVKGKDWVSIKGKSTAVGMYIALYEHNGKLIIFDDCDSVFQDSNGINVLKGALDSYDEREISWLSKGKLETTDGSPVPKTFIFTGKVIFLSNLSQQDIDDAIKSRSFVIEVALSPADMIKYIESKLSVIMPDVKIETKEFALSAIKAAAKASNKVDINMRTLIKAIRILENVDDLSIAKRMIIQQCSYK